MFKNISRLKILIITVMPALFAGFIFLLCGFCFTVPKNVTVGGADVGGLTIYEAAAKARESIEKELETKTLTVRGDKSVYTFGYPEIYYKDNIFSLLKHAKKGDKLTPSVTYCLHGFDEIVQGICQSERVAAVEPSAKFNISGEPFTYDGGRDGKEVVKSKLADDLRASLAGGFETVNVAYKVVNREKTLEEVKKSTEYLAGFTTYYDSSNVCRSSNIRLAANKLNGKILESGKTLSFNDIVGERTKARGFLSAKIIENGEFVEGVGGGVCQVSTTLYNCALLAGMDIAEYHPHSLAVGYVPPSRDAMVSGTSFDLKITNNSDCPVYIRGRTGNGYVTFEIYGKKGGAVYSLSSKVTETLPAPEEITDDPAKAKTGKDGLASEGYLTVVRGGYSKTVRLRKDKYLPVKHVKYVGEEEGADENPEESAEKTEG